MNYCYCITQIHQNMQGGRMWFFQIMSARMRSCISGVSDVLPPKSVKRDSISLSIPFLLSSISSIRLLLLFPSILPQGLKMHSSSILLAATTLLPAVFASPAPWNPVSPRASLKARMDWDSLTAIASTILNPKAFCSDSYDYIVIGGGWVSVMGRKPVQEWIENNTESSKWILFWWLLRLSRRKDYL